VRGMGIKELSKILVVTPKGCKASYWVEPPDNGEVGKVGVSIATSRKKKARGGGEKLRKNGHSAWRTN